MEIVIAGAGIGGLAAARGLLREHHAIRVLEKAPSLREGGAAVTIFSNGFAALTGLGVSATDLGGAIEEMEFRTDRGTLLSRVDLRVFAARTGFPVRTVPRSRLIARLAEGLPRDLVQLGRGVADAELQPGHALLTDTGGDRHRADILVGADGHRSAVRRLLVAPEPAADAGWATWQGLTRVLPEIAGGTRGRFLVGKAGFVGMMPAGDGLVQWWFDTPWSRQDPLPASAADWLRNRFAGYAEPVSTLLAEVRDGDLGLYPHVVHQIPDRWGDGRTTLVGDAAHAFPPTQAQGANQTLEDAWLLARALRMDGDPAELLRRYEARRAPRVRRVSRLAATEATNKVPNPLARIAGRVIPPRLAGLGYLRLVRTWSSVLDDEPSRT